MTPFSENKLDHFRKIIYLLIGIFLISVAYYFAHYFNVLIINDGLFYDPWIWLLTSLNITIGLGLLCLFLETVNKTQLIQFVIPILFSIWYFVLFESDLTIDDGGIVLKYLDNAKKGYFFVYNIGDKPVWGISCFFHGLLSIAIAMFTPVSAYGALMVANFIELCFLGWALFKFVSDYSQKIKFQYLYWVTGMILTCKVIICSKQGLETGLHVGLILLTLHLFFNRAKHPQLLILAWVLCLMSKLDSAPIIGVMGIWFLYENKTKIITLDKTIYKHIVLFGVIPGIVWIVFTHFLFGSILPQTAIAKQFPVHTYGPGLDFVLIFFNNRPKFWLLIMLVLLIAFVCRHMLRKKDHGLYKNDIYYIPLLALFGHLLLYVFYNPKEAMIWYFVIPDLLFAYIMLYSLHIILHFIGSITNWAHKISYSFLLGSLFLSFFIYLGYLNARSIAIFWHTRTVQERAFKEVGVFIKQHSVPTDTMFCGHGYPAREAGLYNIDEGGLNYVDVTELKINYFKILEKYSPDWVATIRPSKELTAGNVDQMKWFNTHYDLVKVYQIDYTQELLGIKLIVPYYIWKHKDRSIGVKN